MSEGMTVYMHIVPNGKRYVGITASYYPEHRFSNGSGYIGNERFYADIQKYGWDNIQHIICAEGLDIPEACDLEVQLIREFDTTNPENGYNKSKGGDYYKYCKTLIPEQEEMNSILREAMKGIEKLYTESIHKLCDLIQG